MRKLLLALMIALRSIPCGAQVYTGGATFTYELENNDCPITITIYYSISGGTKPRIVSFSHTYTIGDTYTFPGPLLSPGEFIGGTSFNFCTSGGCDLKNKSEIDGGLLYDVSLGGACSSGGCSIFTTDLGNNSYKMRIRCTVGG